MTDATFTVAELDDLTAGTDVTNDVVAADWGSVHNEEGDGALAVPSGVTLTPSPIGRAVVVRHDSVPAFTWVAEVQAPHEVAAGEGAAEFIGFNGRGLAALLDRYIVRPTLGFGRSPWALNRTFSAFSPEYDLSAWGTATEYGAQGDASTFWTGLPNGFPAFDVQLIGPSEGDQDSAPQGYWWTANDDGDFVLDDDALLVFFAAADNAADIYFDGFKLVGISAGGDTTRGFRESAVFTVFASAGAHRVGAKVVNTTPDGADPGYGEGADIGGNPTFFLLVGYTTDSAGRLLERVVETSAAWRLLSYPDDPPGLTIAEVAGVVVDENVADGIDPTFTLAVNGSFDPLETVTVGVGDHLLKLVKDWAQAGYLDWHVPPTALELGVWPFDARGSASGVVFDTDTDPNVASLLDLRATLIDVGTDCLMVTWQGGHVRVPDSGGTRMGFLSTRAATVGEAKTLGAAVLARDPQPEQVQIQVGPTGVGDVPGVDFDTGDTVAAGSYGAEKVVGWSVDYDDSHPGGLRFGVTLKDRIKGDDERLALMVRRAAPGQLGGTGPSSPAGDPPPFGTSLRPGEQTFQPLDPLATGESPDKILWFSGNLYAVAVTAKAAGSSDTEFEMLVGGVDVLSGAGVLPSGEDFVLLPVDPIVWCDGNATRLAVNITTVGTDVAGLMVEPRFV